MLKMYDMVRLVSVPHGCDVKVGAEGVVLMVLRAGGNVAYEVEFVGHWKEITYTVEEANLELMD